MMEKKKTSLCDIVGISKELNESTYMQVLKKNSLLPTESTQPDDNRIIDTLAESHSWWKEEKHQMCDNVVNTE